MTTSTTGTGTITLGSAVSGFQSFADGGISNGETVAYAIEDGDNWEVGTGTYTSSGTTLTRSVTESNNSDAAISLSGNAVIFVTALAGELLVRSETRVLDTGFTTTVYSEGTKSSGTFTPDPANGNMQSATNGGAHTLAPPSSSCTLIIQYTNNGSAGTITTSGFTLVDGDTISTTNGDDFLFYITKSGSFSYLHVKALQ